MEEPEPEETDLTGPLERIAALAIGLMALLIKGVLTALDDVGADDDSVIVVPVGAHVKRQSGGISGYPTTLRASVGADRGREHRVGIQAGVI